MLTVSLIQNNQSTVELLQHNMYPFKGALKKVEKKDFTQQT